MLKIVFLFLMLMVIVSMVGSFLTKLFRPDPPPPPPPAPRAAKGQSRARCVHCGREVIGTAPCVCGKG